MLVLSRTLPRGFAVSSRTGRYRDIGDARLKREPWPGTAVVVLIHGNETLWQRPVLGYGLFPVTSLVGPVEVIALDTTGNELGRWQDSFE